MVCLLLDTECVVVGKLDLPWINTLHFLNITRAMTWHYCWHVLQYSVPKVPTNLLHFSLLKFVKFACMRERTLYHLVKLQEFLFLLLTGASVQVSHTWKCAFCGHNNPPKPAPTMQKHSAWLHKVHVVHLSKSCCICPSKWKLRH